MGSQGETKQENLSVNLCPLQHLDHILHLCDKSETHFTRRGAYGEMTKLLPMKLSTNGI